MKLVKTIQQLAAEIVVASPGKAAGSILLTLALSATEGISLVLLMPLLELVGIEEQTTMPRVANWFGAFFEAISVTPTLGAALIVFVAVAGIRALLMRWHSSVNSGVREAVTNHLRVRLYRSIANAEWSFIVTRKPSEFVNALNGEIPRTGTAAHQIIELTVAIAISIVYLGLAFHFSMVMSVVVLCCAGLLAGTIRGNIRKAKTVGGRAASIRNEFHAAVTEHVASLKTAKSYGATEHHEQIFVGLSNEIRQVTLQVVAGQTELQQRLEFGSIALLAVIVYLSYEVMGVTAAQLLILLFIFSRMMPRLVSIYRQIQSLAGVLPVIESLRKLEHQLNQASQSVHQQDNLDLRLERAIRLEDISFTYPSRLSAAALRNIDLEIGAGLTTAIVGSSGAGKSTMADMLLGLLSPTSGRLLIDGEELIPERLGSWRRHIAYVPQETFLFHDTVRANLVWARPDATDEELWNALEMASADEFVSALPNGLDTVIGERGVLLSGGERQRLSLARALVRRPSVLVLDEATSSLDSENEARIQKAVQGLHHQMTIVVITHRLSTIRNADVIHVLENGRLVETGRWNELLRADGRFARLCKTQGIISPSTHFTAEPPRNLALN